MESTTPWWPVLASLFSLWVGYRLGYRQAMIASKSRSLNITKALPKLGTRVRIDKRQEEPSGFPPRYYLIATIYNEGGLAASQLKGRCGLFSAENQVKEQRIPIFWDFFGRTQYELERIPLVGTTVDPALRGEQSISFNLDIEFDYLVPPIDETQHYSAKYRYDTQSRQMVKDS